MVDIEKLRSLANEAIADECWEPQLGLTSSETAFAKEASPAAVLELIEEVERLRAILDDPEYPPKYARRLIAKLRAEVDDYKRGAEVEAKLGDEARAELRHAREQLQSLIDQTTPLEPVPGDPKWSRRIQLDEVIAERDQLRAEVEALREAVKFASVVMGVVAENESLAEVEKRSLLCEVRRCDAAMAAKEGE